MKRGQRPSAEWVVLTLRQIEVQTAQGKSLALACKETEISEQNSATKHLHGGVTIFAPDLVLGHARDQLNDRCVGVRVVGLGHGRAADGWSLNPAPCPARKHCPTHRNHTEIIASGGLHRGWVSRAEDLGRPDRGPTP